MADPKNRLVSNVAGNFFVDATCINCDTCRQLAPSSFEEFGEFSAVRHQPEGERQIHQAYQALLACPVGSIGTEQGDKGALHAAMASFPLLLEDGVFFCGFNAEKSFGANSFFVEHPAGNWLIDSPRYVKHLVEVLDCTDKFATRHAINRACVAAAKPLVSGAAVRFDGQVGVFDTRDPAAPCYHCLFGEGEEVAETRCATMGVFAPLVGVVGARQAAEALKLIAGTGRTLAGRLLVFDALSSQWRELRVPRDPHCPVCAHRPGMPA